MSKFKKKFPNAVDFIGQRLGSLTRISKVQSPFSRAGEGMRVDLQKEPYRKYEAWWALFAFQTGDHTIGSLEVECDVQYEPGSVAQAMLRACGDQVDSQGHSKQYVLWAIQRPPDVSLVD